MCHQRNCKDVRVCAIEWNIKGEESFGFMVRIGTIRRDKRADYCEKAF